MAALTACTALVAALTTGFTVGTYQRAYTQTIGLTPTEIYGDVIHSGDGLPDALPYRYYFWEPYSNRGMAAYLPDRTSFLSTLYPRRAGGHQRAAFRWVLYPQQLRLAG